MNTGLYVCEPICSLQKVLTRVRTLCLLLHKVLTGVKTKLGKKMNKFLNATEAAFLLGVSKTTVADWCQRGFVPGAEKVGTIWIIPKDSLGKIDRPQMGRPPKEENGNNGREEG